MLLSPLVAANVADVVVAVAEVKAIDDFASAKNFLQENLQRDLFSFSGTDDKITDRHHLHLVH